jgi:hypothetical protein
VDLQTYYRVKRPQVVSEIIDGEAVVINLDKGIYYSMIGSGAVIWNYFETGATIQQIVAALCSQYTGESSHITKIVLDFAEQLFREELVISGVAGPVPAQNTTIDTINTSDSSALTKRDFVPPVLEKFTDMEALLLLDPIHEVSEQGWPSPLEDAEN